MASGDAPRCVALSDSESDSDDASWKWEGEEEIPQTSSHCLFCQQTFLSTEKSWRHCSSTHGFDIRDAKQRLHLDCIEYIKMVNYIRQQEHPEPMAILNCSRQQPLWASDVYMKPVLEDDTLLQFDIESVQCDEVDPGAMARQISAMTDDLDSVMLSHQEYMSLLHQLQQAQANATKLEEALKDAVTELCKMRLVAKDLMMSQEVKEPRRNEHAVSNLTVEEDDSYFETYGHFSIHQEMLQDRVRTESYRDAICMNGSVFQDKVVLDIGCGTGILSMFAAKAGARMVIGVDQSDVIYQAMDIVRENGLEYKIKLIKGRMEEVELPMSKVDIIISEWMGYFLLYESMLDTVLYARDHYLVKGGLLLPDHCSLHLVALADTELRKNELQFWDDVYGFRMTCMKAAVTVDPSVLVVNKEKVISDTCKIKDIDICTCEVASLDFTSPFMLEATRDGDVTAFVGYFDINFGHLPEQISFSTSPFHKSTHWKQTLFLLEEPLHVVKGEKLEGRLTCRKNRKDPRSLDITIRVKGRTVKYHMQ